MLPQSYNSKPDFQNVDAFKIKLSDYWFRLKTK